MNIILIIQSFIGSILGIIMVMGLSAIFKQHKMNFKIGMITVGVYWSIIGTYHLIMNIQQNVLPFNSNVYVPYIAAIMAWIGYYILFKFF